MSSSPKHGSTRRKGKRPTASQTTYPSLPVAAKDAQPSAAAEPPQDDGDFPLVTAKDEYRRAQEAAKAGEPTPMIPANWPPPGWETPLIPADSSFPAIRQWLDLGVKTLQYLDVSYNFRREDKSRRQRKRAAGRYYRDGQKLLLALNRTELMQDCKETDALDPLDVCKFLKNIEKGLESSPSKLVEKIKKKRSTQKGEGRAKLIATLTKYHQYADGGCLNLEPVGNNQLARMAKVKESTASAFFKKQYGGHAKYCSFCRDPSSLVSSLKMLNGEFSPQILYGGRPPGEDNRDKDDE